MSNHIKDLVDFPKESKLIICMWIFRKKLRMGGMIDKFKAKQVVVDYI